MEESTWGVSEKADIRRARLAAREEFEQESVRRGHRQTETCVISWIEISLFDIVSPFAHDLVSLHSSVCNSLSDR